MSSKSISPSELARRYADALLQEARENKDVDTVAAELEALCSLNAESPEFQMLLTSFVITKEERRDAMNAVIEKMNFSDVTRRFLGVVMDNDRLFLLPRMCETYGKMRDEMDGYMDVFVTCAAQPDDDVADRLMAAVGAVYNKKIRLNVTVDDSVIGGLAVRVGSMLVDGTVKAKLQKLNQVMKGVGL